MTKQSIFVEYILLQKKSSSFAGAHWQINTTILQNQPGEIEQISAKTLPHSMTSWPVSANTSRTKSFFKIL